MKKKNIRLLIDYLVNKKTLVSSSELAQYVGVSKRQIYNYVSSINCKCEKTPIILSSKKGYYLNPEQYKNASFPFEKSLNHPEQRQNYLLQRLLCSKTGCDIFDLAEELFVSLPTIENDFTKIRSEILPYSLQVSKNKSILELKGDEKDKRELVKDMCFMNNNDWNSIHNENTLILNHQYQEAKIRKNIKNILLKNNIYTNGFALNFIIQSIIIIIERVSAGFLMKGDIGDTSKEDSQYYYATKEIYSYLQKAFLISLNTYEMYNLENLISINSSIINPSEITINNISNFIEDQYIEITRNIINQVQNQYPIVEFNDDFFIRFTLHIKNLFIRDSKKYYARNPLKSKIKYSYPLVHDISVFIALVLEKEYQIILNEDEITYFTIHLCSCLYNLNQEQVTSTLVYADYYNFYQKTIDLLTKTFQDELLIKFSVSLSEYIPSVYPADIIISSVDTRLPDPHLIINPFPTKEDIDNLREKIEQLQNQKKFSYFRKNFLDFFDEHFFSINKSEKYNIELIKSMCQNVIDAGFAQAKFLDDVLDRERMSNTAFHNIAVPHSLSTNTNRSFISAVINDPPIIWGKAINKVSIVLLIGIHQDDRKVFSQIFDFLIEIMSDCQNIKRLVVSKDYDDFIKMIDEMAHNVSWQ